MRTCTLSLEMDRCGRLELWARPADGSDADCEVVGIGHVEDVDPADLPRCLRDEAEALREEWRADVGCPRIYEEAA